MLYHLVGENRSLFTVKPEEFKKQVEYLAKKKYNIVSLADLLGMIEQGNIPKKIVVLTFDDGFQDFYFNVLPLLKKYNFKATMFLSTGFMGKKRQSRSGDWLQILDWPEIKEIQETGLVDFQPHSITHPKLDKEPLERAKQEISGSKMAIEEALDKNCRFFAFPFGNYNEQVIEVLRNHNFKAGLTVE